MSLLWGTEPESERGNELAFLRVKKGELLFRVLPSCATHTLPPPHSPPLTWALCSQALGIFG